MKILAIDFSTNQRDVAVLEGPPLNAGGVGDGSIRLLAEQRATTPRDVSAIELVDAALTTAGVERETVECLAIGLGPGSYTGIRIAIALAQGWQLARPVATVGLSSMDCLAAEFAATRQGRFWVVLDAQRNEHYLAGGETTDSDWCWVEPLHLATAEETRAKTADGGTRIGPEINRWFDDGLVIHPGAARLGRMVWQRGVIETADRLEPIYLRSVSFVKAPPPRQIPSE